MSDGNQLAIGKLFIRGVGSQIDLFFVSGNSNWINRITGTLRDIDMSDYDISMTGPNINALRTATEGIIFPIIDWAYNFQKLNNIFQITNRTPINSKTIYDLYPCFYHHTVFERLFESYDLKLSGPLFNDTIYKSLIFTPEQIIPDHFVAPTQGGGAKLLVTGGRQEINNTTSLLQIIEATDSGSMEFHSSNNSVNVLDEFENAVFYADIIVSMTSGSPPKSVDIILYKNGISFVTYSFVTPTTSSYVLTISPDQLGPVDAGDVFQIYVKSYGFTVRVLQVVAHFGLNNPVNFLRMKTVMPEIDQIDFIKHIAQRFNCLIDFDEPSQTVIFTPLDKIKRSEALDISDKIISYKQIPTSVYAARNYIRTPEAEELATFKVNNLAFGDAVIESDGEGEQDLYTTIFGPAYTAVNPQLEWLQTYVPLLKLEDDDDGIAYTAVSSSSGNAKFTNGTLFSAVVSGAIVRIESSSGQYTGYGLVLSADSSGMILRSPFGATDTGRVYHQRVTYPNCGSRELIVVPDISINTFNYGSPIYGDQNIKLYDGSTWPYASAAWAFYAKPSINTALDNIKTGLNYGEITDATNISFGDLYNKVLRKIVQGRQLECELLLTETEYNNLALARYFYLRTKDISGYFVITDMGGYLDNTTPILFNLVLID